MRPHVSPSRKAASAPIPSANVRSKSANPPKTPRQPPLQLHHTFQIKHPSNHHRPKQNLVSAVKSEDPGSTVSPIDGCDSRAPKRCVPRDSAAKHKNGCGLTFEWLCCLSQCEVKNS
ncbi:hypothetical protein NL676_015370 [Syzygium grande]|nr:hypothetical protein NL676_015370 [Syzygium grande]